MAVARVSSSWAVQHIAQQTIGAQKPGDDTRRRGPQSPCHRDGIGLMNRSGGIRLPTWSADVLPSDRPGWTHCGGMRVPSAEDISSWSAGSKVAVLYNVTARPSASKPDPTLGAGSRDSDLHILFSPPPFMPVPANTAQHKPDAALYGFDLTAGVFQRSIVHLLHKICTAIVVLIHQTSRAINSLHHGRSCPFHTHIVCGGSRNR